jgi:hypothetical protein
MSGGERRPGMDPRDRRAGPRTLNPYCSKMRLWGCLQSPGARICFTFALLE